jgi:hypothetical protein
MKKISKLLVWFAFFTNLTNIDYNDFFSVTKNGIYFFYAMVCFLILILLKNKPN